MLGFQITQFRGSSTQSTKGFISLLSDEISYKSHLSQLLVYRSVDPTNQLNLMLLSKNPQRLRSLFKQHLYSGEKEQKEEIE